MGSLSPGSTQKIERPGHIHVCIVVQITHIDMKTSVAMKVYVNTTESLRQHDRDPHQREYDLCQHLAVGDFCDVGIPYVCSPDLIVQARLA